MLAAPERGSSGGGDADIEDEAGSSNPLGALGDSKWWPPGFRFHPTDEELVLYYLKRKVFRRRIRPHVISDLDVYKWEPWDLPEKSMLKSRDKQWYYFSPRDRKYPNGSRSNRTTRCGYWKATGKDRTISHGARAVGNKKTLVYYQGRAPKGQRSDWVMHEYTLDDNVLINRNNAQESYALYKLFRKSGPGPKNGEEYGAPFREEEWDNDNGDLNDGFGSLQDCMAELVSDNLSRDDESLPTVVGNNASSLPFDGLAEFLLQMTNDQVEIPQQVGFEEPAGNHSIEFGTSNFDASRHTEQHNGWCEQDVGADFLGLQQASVCPPPIEPLEVTSAINCSELALLGNDEEFLEIGDFIDPVLGMDENSQTDQADGIDEFYNPYDCFDADMFLAEAMGTLNGTVQSPYLDGFNFDDDAQNQATHFHITNELWTHDQSVNGFTVAESKPVVLAPPASGVLCNDNVSNLDGNSRGQTGHTESSPESWFSSVLATMLENVPSRPAIASENALISRALERVTSFKGGQFGNRVFNSTMGGGADLVRRKGGGNGGFVFTSLLVGLGAILWLLTIGAAVKVLKVIWSRFLTS